MSKRKNRQPVPEAEDESAPGAKKAAPCPGEYPPLPVLESAAFESYYRESGIVPDSEWDAFLSSLRQPLGVSFRITGHPSDPSSIALRDYMERQHVSRLGSLVVDDKLVPPPYPISWYPGRMAWRFDVSRSILRGKGELKFDESPAARTLASFHHFLMTETELGAISRQEEVSMVPPCLLDVRPGHTVGDLCAAPGSKTQQLIEAVDPPVNPAADEPAGPSGMVIANDMDYKRAHVLVSIQARKGERRGARGEGRGARGEERGARGEGQGACDSTRGRVGGSTGLLIRTPQHMGHAWMSWWAAPWHGEVMRLPLAPPSTLLDRCIRPSVSTLRLCSLPITTRPCSQPRWPPPCVKEEVMRAVISRLLSDPSALTASFATCPARAMARCARPPTYGDDGMTGWLPVCTACSWPSSCEPCRCSSRAAASYILRAQ